MKLKKRDIRLGLKLAKLWVNSLPGNGCFSTSYYNHLLRERLETNLTMITMLDGGAKSLKGVA